MYITTPIYYVNGSPHIGHAYTSTQADILSRYATLSGKSVTYQTGVDEHGEKVAQKASSMNKQPKEFCDEVKAEFDEMSRSLECKPTDVVRTTDGSHMEGAQAFWRRMEEVRDRPRVNEF